MRSEAMKPDVLAGYKDQATRLREYLSAGGVDLKHTNALEAVARMHGFSNYHLLQHATSRSGEVWLVSTFTGGLMPINLLARTVADGIALFCHQLARVATQEVIEIQVRAQPSGAHRGLYALNYGALVVTLTQPPTPSVNEHGELQPFEALPFPEIAAALSDAVYERSGWARFTERVEDEGFLQRVMRGIDVDVLRGALEQPNTAGSDERTILASRYLMGIVADTMIDAGKGVVHGGA